MNKQRLLLFAPLAMAVALAAYWLIGFSGQRANIDLTTAGPVVELSPTGDVETAGGQSVDSASTLPDSTRGCLPLAQLGTHPMFAAEAARLDSVAITGPTIASYRGLSARYLENLAIQGDSAAMAVLGAMSLLRVRNMPEQSAVPFLLYEDFSLHTYPVLATEDATVRQHLETAGHWFYQSALHGRLFALSYIGYVRALLEGGAVGLGWIEENEYSELQDFEIGAFLPQTIYKALPFEIAPQLRSGPSGIAYDNLPKNEWQAAILAELVEQFEQDRIAAELPPISVSESTAPSSEEMRVVVCGPFY